MYRDSPIGRIPAGVISLIGMSFFGAVALVDYFLGFHWTLLTVTSLWIAGLGLLSFAAGHELLWYYRKRYWKRGEGSVIGQVSDGDSCFPKISYSIGDKNMEFVSNYDNVQVKVGRKSDVYYCSSCLAAEEYPRYVRLHYSVFVGLIGLMLVGLGVSFLLR